MLKNQLVKCFLHIVFYKGLVKLRTKGEDVDLITSQICNLIMPQLRDLF